MYIKVKIYFFKNVNSMKYIKKYKIFESNNNDILEDLNDICLELKDSGFDISITQSSDQFESYFKIEIALLMGKNRIFFDFNDDIQDIIIRINQYMRELGYKTSYKANRDIFIIRPDEKLRYTNGLWIRKTEQTLGIEMQFYIF